MGADHRLIVMATFSQSGIGPRGPRKGSVVLPKPVNVCGGMEANDIAHEATTSTSTRPGFSGSANS